MEGSDPLDCPWALAGQKADYDMTVLSGLLASTIEHAKWRESLFNAKRAVQLSSNKCRFVYQIIEKVSN